MKIINQIPKLHLLVSKDRLRPAMMHVHIKAGIVSATDAHVLVSMPMELLFERTEETELFFKGEMFIEAKEFKKICNPKSSFIVIKESLCQIEVKNERWETMDIALFKTDVGAKYPDVANVVPDIKDNDKIPYIGVNAEKIAQFHNVFGKYCNLKMMFFGEHKPILIVPYFDGEYREEIRALIMPIMLNY